MPIQKSLTVVTTANYPTGAAQTVDLICVQGGVEKAAKLSTVLVNLVSGSMQEVQAFATGAIAVTKITSGCTGTSVYVRQGFYDVYAAQNPCCGAAPAPNITPVPPTVTADDTQGQDWLAAAHALGISEIVVADGSNPSQYVQLTAHPLWNSTTNRLDIGNVNRPSGFFAFKIKAGPGRNESAVALSPAFTVAAQQLATPNVDRANITASSFDIVVSPVTNATAYEIEVHDSAAYDSPLATYTLASNANPLSFTFTGGQPYTTYYFRLRAKATGYTTSAWRNDSATTLENWNTILEFSSSNQDDGAGVNGAVAGANANQEFAFNSIASPVQPSQAMRIRIGGTEQILIDFPGEYAGQNFRYKDLSGTYRRSTFINGFRDF